MYKEHLADSQVKVGIKEGDFFQGTIRMNRYNPTEGHITHPTNGKVRSEFQQQAMDTGSAKVRCG